MVHKVSYHLSHFCFTFYQVLIKVIREYCHCYHLLEMLTKVNERIVDKQTCGGPNRVMTDHVPYLTHTLRAKVHLGMKVMNRILTPHACTFDGGLWHGLVWCILLRYHLIVIIITLVPRLMSRLNS